MRLKTLTDEKLLELWVNGNEKAANTLYTRHAPKAIAFCKRHYQSLRIDECEDLVHDTFLRIINIIYEGKLKTPQNFKHYLYEALKNNFNDSYRTKKRRKKLVKQGVIRNKMVTYQDEQDDFESLINNIKAFLGDQLNQEIIELVIKGFSNKEISKEHKIHRNTVRNRIKFIREYLGRIYKEK